MMYYSILRSNKKLIKIKSQYELSRFLTLHLKKQHIDSSSKLVLLMIAQHTNPTNNWECYPSGETLEELSCFGHTAVFKCVRKLKELGFISYKKGGIGRANVYTVDVGAISKAIGVEAAYSSPPSTKKAVAPKKETKYIYNDGEDDEDAYQPF